MCADLLPFLEGGGGGGQPSLHPDTDFQLFTYPDLCPFLERGGGGRPSLHPDTDFQLSIYTDLLPFLEEGGGGASNFIS